MGASARWGKCKKVPWIFPSSVSINSMENLSTLSRQNFQQKWFCSFFLQEKYFQSYIAYKK